ncbi:MAG: hypothetical protein GC136_06805 [Alphaproteobacteria bacterium]|nr:hypothetical protein [Alphaproteobacteria bacterium]
MSRDYQDVLIYFDMPGGGTHGIGFMRKAQHVLGRITPDLIEKPNNFLDFRGGASVTALIQTALSVPHEGGALTSVGVIDEAVSPRYSFNEVAKLLEDHIPFWLPNKDWKMHYVEQILKRPFTASARALEGLTRRFFVTGAQTYDEAKEQVEYLRELWEAYSKQKKSHGNLEHTSEALKILEDIAKEMGFDVKDKSKKEKKKSKPWSVRHSHKLNEFVLKHYMKEHTFVESAGSYVVNGYKIGPDEQSDMDLLHIDPKLFERFPAQDNHSADSQKELLRLSSFSDNEKLYAAALGATAVPSYFDSYNLKAVNAHLVDQALINNPSHNMILLRHAFPKARIIYIKVGGAVDRSPIAPHEYREESVIGLVAKGHIANPAQIKQLQQQRLSAERLFGKENVFFLIDGLDQVMKPPKMDIAITDGRKVALEKIKSVTDETIAINPEIYDRLTDTLAGVFQARTAARADAAFSTRVARTEPEPEPVAF